MAEWWGPIAAGAGVVGAVGGFGYFMDNKLDDAFRAKVRAKLTRVPPEGDAAGDDNWPSLFLAMFDRLFDPKGKGRPRFWRSAAASLLVLTMLLVAWAVLLPERAGDSFGLRPSLWVRVVAYFGFGVVINVVGDFFSLWESRFVIGRMATAPGAIRKAAFLLLDLSATVAIYFSFLAFSFLIFGMILRLTVGGPASAVDPILYVIGDMFANSITEGGLLYSHVKPVFDLLATYFYTTLFTSVWVWLFMLGGVLWPLFTWLRGVLRVDKFPVGSAMAIGGVFGGLVVTALGYVRMAVLS